MAEVDSGKRYNRVLEIIEKRLIPDEEAKKARGEVFTPLNLVREMLFGLRKSSLEKGKPEIWGVNNDGDFFDDEESNRVGGIPLEVFRDSESKWFDPANGIGNFAVVAFYMLDYQLDRHGENNALRGYENTKKRQEHIVKNMLYMIELNKGNVNASIKIFKLITPDVEPNICCANTLELNDEKIKAVFGINKFDVIMGNPPYNEGGTSENGITIWPYFISNNENKYPFPGALNLLKVNSDSKKDNGSLAFIIPASWRNGLEKVWETLRENTFIMIKMSDDFPNVNLPIDAWLLQKGKKEGKTHIIDKEKNYSLEDIHKFPFIPNFGISIFKKILAVKKDNDTLNMLSQSKFDPTAAFGKKHIQKNPDASHIYPIIKTIIEAGPDIYYSDTKDELQDLLKVVIADYTYLYPHIDNKYAGIGRHAYYIPVRDLKEGKAIVKFLNSKLIQFMNFAIKIAGGGVQYKLFKSFPNPPKIFDSDDEIYSLFKIDKGEQKIIKDFFRKNKLKGDIKDTPKYIKDLGDVKKTRVAKPKKGGFVSSRFTRKIRR